MHALVSGFFPATCVLSGTGSPLVHLHREEILCGSVLVCRWRQGERRGGREGGWEKEEEGRRELTPRPSMFQLHQLFIVLSKDTNLHVLQGEDGSVVC